jgi:hypothetical protein
MGISITLDPCKGEPMKTDFRSVRQLLAAVKANVARAELSLANCCGDAVFVEETVRAAIDTVCSMMPVYLTALQAVHNSQENSGFLGEFNRAFEAYIESIFDRATESLADLSEVQTIDIEPNK